MSQPPQFQVFKLKSRLAMQDPDMPSPRYHTVVFVETLTHGPETGVKHQVAGELVNGMYYESKPFPGDGELEILHSKELLGYTAVSSYPHEFDRVLRQLPPPAKQKAFNKQTMKTEPVKSWSPLTFYEPGVERRPLIKCTEWAEQQAIPALFAHGVIVKEI